MGIISAITNEMCTTRLRGRRAGDKKHRGRRIVVLRWWVVGDNSNNNCVNCCFASLTPGGENKKEESNVSGRNLVGFALELVM